MTLLKEVFWYYRLFFLQRALECVVNADPQVLCYIMQSEAWSLQQPLPPQELQIELRAPALCGKYLKLLGLSYVILGPSE